MFAVRTAQLSKRYGDTLALDGFDLDVQEGEVYGYLGPNGAGKTTTIRLLLGLHRPSAGRAELFGVDCWRDPVAAHRRVAYVAGEPFLWPSMTGTETLEFLARLHGETDRAYRDQALRGERGSLAVWLCTIGAFAFIVGVISESISSAGISGQLRRELAKLGSDSIVTPKGYLGLAFIFFVLAVSLFAVSQIAAARHEEADGQLERLLGLPVGRAGWLGGRLALAVAAVASISFLTGLLGWVGAASQGVGVSLAQMLEAGANCLPVAVVFLGIAGLAYALTPRAGVGIAYGLVAVAFLWQLFGSLLGAPKWLVDLTPFAHVGFVPAQPFRGGPAAIMVASGLLAAFAAVALFRRRDLTAH